MANKEGKAKKPFYKKWWFWLIVIIVIFGACSAGSGSDSSDKSSNTEKIEKKKDDVNKNKETTSEKNTAKAVTLGAGTYEVGEGKDIEPGRYVIKAIQGSGNLTSTGSGDINVILGQTVDNTSGQVDSYTTDLKSGTKVKIEGINQTSFTPVTNRQFLTQLTAGQWVVGKDIKAGRYKVVATQGSGNFHSNDGDINEILGTTADDTTEQVKGVTVNLHKGEVIDSDLQGVQLQAK